MKRRVRERVVGVGAAVVAVEESIGGCLARGLCANRWSLRVTQKAN